VYTQLERGCFLVRIGRSWETPSYAFPHATSGAIEARYYETTAPRYLLYDGENTFYTIPYRHRRLRFASVFWALPRLLRIRNVQLLLLRGYNVTERPVRQPRIVDITARLGAA
jgi:hypothetical protein